MAHVQVACPEFQQVETFIATPPSTQCGQSGHLELPRSGKWVGVTNTHLSTSVPVPCVSAPGSASAVPPIVGNPLLAGVRSTERGVGVTTLCRSNSRLAHLVKVPGRFHLQARAQQPVGGTDYPDPTEEGGTGMPSPATSPASSTSCRWPQARMLTSCSSVLVLRLSSSSSLPWA